MVPIGLSGGEGSGAGVGVAWFGGWMWDCPRFSDVRRWS